MAKFCQDCGAAMNDDAGFCPNCGAPVGAAKGQASGGPGGNAKGGGGQTNPTPPKKKSIVKKILLGLAAVLVLILIVGFMTEPKTQPGQPVATTDGQSQTVVPDITSLNLIDANKFNGITAKKLIEIMGQPDTKDEFEQQTKMGNFKALHYIYNNHQDVSYVFTLLQKPDMVTNVDYIFLESDGKTYKKVSVPDVDTVLKALSITPGDSMRDVGNPDELYNLISVADKISEVSVAFTPSGSKTAECVMINYDEDYQYSPYSND